MVSNLHKSLQKRGSTQLSSTMTSLIIGLIVVVMATALAPEMYTNIAALSDEANIPSWVVTVLSLVVSAGLVFLVWNIFMKK